MSTQVALRNALVSARISGEKLARPKQAAKRGPLRPVLLIIKVALVTQYVSVAEKREAERHRAARASCPSATICAYRLTAGMACGCMRRWKCVVAIRRLACLGAAGLSAISNQMA